MQMNRGPLLFSQNSKRLSNTFVVFLEFELKLQRAENMEQREEFKQTKADAAKETKSSSRAAVLSCLTAQLSHCPAAAVSLSYPFHVACPLLTSVFRER